MVGDTCSCPIHGTSRILDGSSSDTCCGKAIAYDGCMTSCGAKVISTTDKWMLEPNRGCPVGTSQKDRQKAAVGITRASQDRRAGSRTTTRIQRDLLRNTGKRSHSPQRASIPRSRRKHPVTSGTHLSDAGKGFISRNEGGNRAIVYRDSQGLPTAGVGHLLNDEEMQRFPVGREVPQEVRDAWFNQDLTSATRAVQRSVQVELTQHQFDALVDFTFNLGPGSLSRSQLLRTINDGQMGRESIEQGFNGWLRGGPGIPARRAREAELFNDGTYHRPSRR